MTFSRYTTPSASIPLKSASLQPSTRKARQRREIDPSKYSTRLIALKFAYLGQRYNGFEYHANNSTPLPTVEEALWKAFAKARLIFPTEPRSLNSGEVNWEGCEYSKCGRTDKGVSAFGQVIGIRVRSNLPVSREALGTTLVADEIIADGELKPLSTVSMRGMGDEDLLSASGVPYHDEASSFDPIKDELPYVQILNRVLPPDIRVLAWCPAPPQFSARFSCRERQYRYFFTQPTFNPTPGSSGISLGLTHDTITDERRREGWLDIEAMKDGAKRFEGVHDFRNFCKVDPSKQIDNFERKMFLSEIWEVDPACEPAAYVSGPGFGEFHLPSNSTASGESSVVNVSHGPRVYMFMIYGSAFLWHQVRHMIAILFLIGQGLESPDLVNRLLDVKQIPQKPMYEMAEDSPLVLWDCIFPQEGSESRKDAMPWVYVGDQKQGTENNLATVPSKGNGKFGVGGVVDDAWKLWREKRIDEILAGMLLNKAVDSGEILDKGVEQDTTVDTLDRKTSNQKVFYGGNSARLRGKYVPVMQRPRMEAVEVINAKYATRKGFEENQEVRDSGFRHVELVTSRSAST